MNEKILSDIQSRLDRLEKTSARLRLGEVTGSGPLDVALGGSDVPYEGVKSIQPVGSSGQVASLLAGNDLLVLGSVTDGSGLVSALPASPVDGQECYFLADSSNGIVWHLRYRAASSSSHKWEFIGGASMGGEVLTGQATTSSSYVDLATAGPSVTLPLAGDYEIRFGEFHNNGPAGSLASVKLGSAATSDNDSCQISANINASASREYVRSALAAGAVLKMQYRSLTGGTSVTFYNRWIRVRPIRVG